MQSIAEQAAQLVKVHYAKPEDLPKPVFTIAAAQEAGSFHDPECAPCQQ